MYLASPIQRQSALQTMAKLWCKDTKTEAIMGIKKEVELYCKVELEIFGKENEQVKKVHEVATLDVKIIDKS